MVLHDLNQASKFADYIIALKDGKVVKSGEPINVITNEILPNLKDTSIGIISPFREQVNKINEEYKKSSITKMIEQSYLSGEKIPNIVLKNINFSVKLHNLYIYIFAGENIFNFFCLNIIFPRQIRNASVCRYNNPYCSMIPDHFLRPDCSRFRKRDLIFKPRCLYLPLFVLFNMAGGSFCHKTDTVDHSYLHFQII